jgi:hypothetical protein
MPRIRNQRRGSQRLAAPPKIKRPGGIDAACPCGYGKPDAQLIRRAWCQKGSPGFMQNEQGRHNDQRALQNG